MPFTIRVRKIRQPLFRDAAHLHEKVLLEVVLGEFHVAVRAPSRTRWKGEKQVGQPGGERTQTDKEDPTVEGGMDASAKSDLSFRFPVNPAREKRVTYLRSLISLKNCYAGSLR